MKNKYLEITGTHFQNKGAELMMIAIVKHFNDHPEFKCAMQPWIDKYELRAKWGLYQKIFYQRFKINWSPLLNLIPEKVRNQFGLVREQDIYALLDASGFLYSDQWDIERIKRAVLKIKNAKKNGKKVILLPQAFGPFSNPKIRTLVTEAINYADLVCARDHESYNNLMDLKSNGNIKMYPDFTNLVKVPKSNLPLFENKTACILPNMRMLDKASKKTQENYINFLIYSIENVIQKNYLPFFLIHETETDRLVLDLLPKSLVNRCFLITELDPLSLKGMIGNSSLVIGSRFHGLIGALSQGVPSIAVGWSHKYPLLFEEYNVAEYIINLENDSYKNSFDDLISKIESGETIEKIKAQQVFLENKTKEMWVEVHNILKS